MPRPRPLVVLLTLLFAALPLVGSAPTETLRSSEELVHDRVAFTNSPPSVEALVVRRPAEHTRPLLVEVPSAPSEIRVEFRDREEVLAREILSIPSGVTSPLVIQLLAVAPDLLARLRRLEEASPGSVMITVASTEAALLRIPLAEADRLSLVAEGRDVIGSTRYLSIPARTSQAHPDGKLPGQNNRKLRQGTHPYVQDEQCLDDCLTWYQICSSECSWRDCYDCDVAFFSCRNGCPYYCVDPKEQNEVYNDTYIGSELLPGTQCFGTPGAFQGHLYELWRHWYRRDYYLRTEMCDGSTTYSYLRSEYWYRQCWELAVWNGCFYPQRRVPSC